MTRMLPFLGTIRLLLVALLLVCCRDQSAPPTVLSARDESRDSRNASSEADARQSNAASLSVAQPQTQEVELWDPNDDRNIAGRMLERVKQEGAIRIVSVHPSRDKYVFVAEVEGEREGDSAKDSTPKTDLWRVNKNGTGLQRLTYDGASYNPEWSPSGDEIAFVNRRYTLPTLEIMETETGSDSARTISWALCESCEFDELRWAPNGQALAALENDGTTTWITVVLPDVGAWSFRDYRIQNIHNLTRGARAYQWSKESDLILGYGRFAFDWEKVLSKVIRQKDEASEPESVETETNTQRDFDPFLKSLLKKVRQKGVARIKEYSPSPSGDRIAFVGGSEDPANADLWIVNRNGTGLRRLMTDVEIDKPIWSPSESGIVIKARASFRNLTIVNVKTGKQRDLLDAEPLCSCACCWEFNYRNPRWSPNGKAINIEAIALKESVGWSSLGGVVVVDASSGNLILFGSDLAWNDEGELVVEDYGKFVFDWDSAIFSQYRHQRK
jgi:Tol biopolymer transport system component